MEIINFLPLVFINGIAYWKMIPHLFLLSAGISMFTGLSWYDNNPTPEGMTICVSLITYSIACLGFTFATLFKRSDVEDEAE